VEGRRETDSALVDDFSDCGDLSRERALVEEDNTANLDEACKVGFLHRALASQSISLPPD
jgi:hypothetical protein